MKHIIITIFILVSAFSDLLAVSDISLDPDRVFVSSQPGGSAVKSFKIINSGSDPLTFNSSINYTSKNSTKSGGGPDSYGYVWRDSDAPDGPVYNWIEIGAIGTEITLTDDYISSSIPLGFAFNFYGTDFTSVKICSNGFLSFTTTASNNLNDPIPTSSEPNNLISLLWDDLDPTAAGKVFYYSDAINKRFIVEYSGLPHYNTTSYNYAQVILYESGRILFQYKTVGASTINTASVGIENSNGSIGLQVVANLPYLKDNLAIQFTTVSEWLSLNNYSGSVPAHSDITINATCNAMSLDYGTYTADLKITSNDPVEPLKILPVTFLVSDVTEWPDIELSETSIDDSALPDASVQDSFSISNSGNANLDYSITKYYEQNKGVLNAFESRFVSSIEGWSNSGARTWSWTTSTSNLDGTPYAYVIGQNNQTKNAVLTSPEFDGTVCTDLYLDFDHRTSEVTPSSFYVYYSADGTNFNQLYSTDLPIGAWGNPDHQRIHIPSISSTMSIRFSASLGSTSTWSIDNVVVSGTEKINYTWLTINSSLTGYVTPSGTNTINLTCNAAGLAEGTYNANITVVSNDPDEPGRIIPVHFTVGNLSSAPDVPSNVITSVSGTDLIVSWNPVTGATSYDIYSSSAPYGTFTFLTNVTTSQYVAQYTETKKFYYIIAKN